MLLLLAMLIVFLFPADARAEGTTGLIQDGNGQWIYVTDGVPDPSVNGLILYEEKWFYLENGVLDTTRNGFVEYDGAKFYLAAGQVADTYSGLVQENGAWYFIANGQFQSFYSGFAEYDNAWFILKDGMLDISCNGLHDYNGGRFLIAAGKIRQDYSGLYQEGDQWYFLADGQIQYYRGLALYDGEWFALENGMLDTGYSGFYDYDGETFLIAAGRLLSEFTGDYSEITDARCRIEKGQVRNLLPLLHSKEEIQAFYNACPYNMRQGVSYATQPSLDSNVAGDLSQTTLQDGLNAVNFMRYIAGIPTDITTDTEYNRHAQDGAFVLAKNNTGLSHYPENTSNIPADLFESGYKGTSSSNLAMGYTNLSDSVIRGWMDDGDASNIDRVGHRRWILSPHLSELGFGYCNGYSTVYVFDHGHDDYLVDYIAWPAENMPAEVFCGPWSLQLSKKKYSSDLSGVRVVMTDVKTGKSWTFDGSTNTDPNNTESMYFNKDTGNYGYMNALIFEPYTTFGSGSQIRVEVFGLKDAKGNETYISYEVNFFTLN